MKRVRQINIPIKQIQERRCDKALLEELACVVMIKQRYNNSVLLKVDTKRIMQFFHVSHGKAVSLLTRFKHSSLFYWNNEKKALYAKSLKSKNEVCYGKHKAYSDYCCKTRLPEKLCDAVKELRAILALNVLNASMRNSEVCLDMRQSTYCKVASVKSILKEKNICKAVGVSIATLCRLLQWLASEGRISKTIIADCVTTDLSDERSHKKGVYIWHADRSAWRMLGSIYLTTESERAAFRNVIWNFRKKRKNDITCKGHKRYCEI